MNRPTTVRMACLPGLFAAALAVVCLAGSPPAWADGAVHGFTRFEKVKGRPDLGHVEMYEYKAFLSPEGDGTGFSYHCGDPGSCPEPYTGCMWFPNVPAGRYALLSCFPEFPPRGTVVSDILVIDGQTTERNAELPLDYCGYVGKDQWDPVGANPVFQTFRATGTGVARIAFAKADDNRDGSIRISVHRDHGGAVEDWPQVGPERVVNRQGYGADHWASWDAGDVPLQPGTMYAVRLYAQGGPNVQPYWCDDVFYPEGRGYRAAQDAPAGHDYHIAVFTDNDGTLATLQVRDWQGGRLAGDDFRQRWAQSYRARGNSLAGAAMKATIGGNDGWSFPLRITVHAGSPDGARIGPAKTMPNAFAPFIGVSGVAYNPGEVPTAVGETYWIVYERPTGEGFNVSRAQDGDVYAGGTAAHFSDNRWTTEPYDLYMDLFEYAAAEPVSATSAIPDPTPGTRPYIYGCGVMWPYWRDIPPERHLEWTLQCFRMIEEMGGQALPADITWIGSEPERGTYDWAKVDMQVEAASQVGLPLFAYTGLTPDWALPPEAPQGQSGIGYRFPPAREFIPDFERWCEAVARRYRGKIKYYEFWNEPNGCSWINDGCGNGHMGPTYVPWLQRWYTAMKKGDPHCVLSVGGLDAGYWSLRFLDDIYEHGGGNFFDAVAIHPYGDPLNWKVVEDTYAMMVRRGDGHKRIWLGEWGTNTTDEAKKSANIAAVLERLKQPEYHYVFYANYLVLTDLDENAHDFGLCDSEAKAFRIAPRASYEAYKAADKTFPPNADRPPAAAEPYVLTVDLPGGIPLELVRVRADSFNMGSPDDQAGRDPDETRHEVALTRNYWMGKYEVTNRQFRAFRPEHRSGDGFDADDQPVVNVTWDDAAAFCRWVSRQTGHEVRLPTEAEWEYAARAANEGRYCFGDGEPELADHAWFDRNAGGAIHPVGRKRASIFGLYDLHGNAAEWCADRYGDYPAGPAADPGGPAGGAYRVSRGGAWSGGPAKCRSADRDAQAPAHKSSAAGFRVACSGAQRTGGR